MKVVIQRVSKASSHTNHKFQTNIDLGLVLLVGFGVGDTSAVLEKMAKKIVTLRIFADNEDKMSKSIQDVYGKLLVIPNFTLFGEVKGQNKPYFGSAAEPVVAKKLFTQFIGQLKKTKIPTYAGEFGAYMQIELTNDGPVTLVLDSSGL